MIFRKMIMICLSVLILLSCKSTDNNDKVMVLLKKMTLEEKIGQLCCPIGFNVYDKLCKDSIMLSDSFVKTIDTMKCGGFWAVFRADPWSRKTLETGLDARESALLFNKMQRYVIDNTRLGIPLFIAEECGHGHMAVGATVFPVGLGQAATWDDTLLYKVGEAVALEAEVTGSVIGYGPVMDVARDPRWSRVEESFGEDPYRPGRLGTAVMKGMQRHLASTLKHFTGYGMPVGGHNGAATVIGNHDLLNDCCSNFETAVKSGAASIMTSYNAVDGKPCTSNKWLLNDVLREKWDFDGVVFSDLGSIWALHSYHRVAEDQLHATAMAMNAGVDIDLGASNYGAYLEKAVETGLVSVETVDNAVSRVLKLKFEAGLFDNPYINVDKVTEVVNNDNHKRLALKTARESVVLLKNNGVLPLKKDLKRIAVIGPNADNMYNQLGDYTAPQKPDKIITVLEGIRDKVSDMTEVLYTRGCYVRDTSWEDFENAVLMAKKSDVVVLVVGGSSARDFSTYYENTGAALVNDIMSDMDCGEGYDRASLELAGRQNELMKLLIDTGKPLIVIYIEGRPYLKNYACQYADALLTAWYPGEQGGNAVAEILFGEYNPAGRLPVSIPRSVGQIPIYYSLPPAHNYVDEMSSPLFPFGYGLSYTEFEYDNMKVTVFGNVDSANDDEPVLEVSFLVANTGDYDGDEVVQLYVRDEYSSFFTPAEKSLKDFKREYFKKGEKKEMRFVLYKKDLSVFDSDFNRVFEHGKFTIMVGASSDDIRLKEIIYI